MSRHDHWKSVQDMLDHAREAVALTQGVDRDDMDRVKDLALTHLMEIIGEAANRVPTDFRKRHSSIP